MVFSSSSTSSTSDGDAWALQSRPPVLSTGSGQSVMLEARRRELQRQREAQRQERQSGARVAGGLGTRAQAPTSSHQKESPLPDIFGGSEDDAVHSASAAPSFPSLSSPPLPKTSATALPPPPHEVTVEQLQRQIAAKQKLLHSTRERETALMEKWRAAKAQKQAEIEQLNGKLRRVLTAIEDQKSVLEREVREAQDEHEAQLRAARRDVEQAVKAEYDAKIAEVQLQLDAAKKEESHLRDLLQEKSGGGGSTEAAKDVAKTALTAAVSAILRRLDEVFDSEGAEEHKMDMWRSELQSLVQHEIQTSFAVGVESSAQAERTEYARFFDDMLAFWRSAEDQERERLLKMDESLLVDVQAIAHQEMKRLQDEALGMERVYVESREAWALEHQRSLQREMEAMLQRQEVELREQRRQRHELHVERLRDAEARHKDLMASEEALHQRQMEQLQAYFCREEDLRAELRRVHAAAQEDVAKSTALLRDVMAVVEEAAAAVKSYEAEVHEKRRRVEAEREENFKEHAEMLMSLQQLAATQCSNVDEERKALEDCTSQLRVASQNLDRHLQDESAWLVQQETTCKRSKDEWEREYRRWQHLVQQERQAAEEHFRETLLVLQQSIGLLDTEERDLAVETAAIHRTFGDMEALAQKEIESLRRRAADVQSRYAAIADAETQLSQKKAAMAEAKQQLTNAQQRLEEERAELRLDEERLRDMVEALRVARSQAALRSHNIEVLRAADSRLSRQPAEATAATAMDSDRLPVQRGQGTSGARHRAPHIETKSNSAVLRSAASTKKRTQHRDPHRLPNRVLQELQEQLHSLATSTGNVGRDAFVSTTRWIDPPLPRASGTHQARQARQRQREADRDTFADDLPAPLSAPPPLHHKSNTLREARTNSRLFAAEQRECQVDSSLLPFTSDGSSQLSLRADQDLSATGNTFTNLVGLSDIETTS
ncbi:hypothetical protein JKF63_01325 [Porcisia hertigi]|uniref:Uncharacterized protein n=1 Tax=Porcisia hertigi TaxID=2761500 RepID=A0A836ICR6_9TRYP|nr:hypothetical protein JKF63_01325 [Porcisia hertigi]